MKTNPSRSRRRDISTWNFFDWSLCPNLNMHIALRQRDRAHELLDQLLKNIDRHADQSLIYRKLNCAQIAGTCARGGHRGCAPSQELLDVCSSFCSTIGRQRSWPTICATMHTFLDEVIDLVPLPMDSRTEGFVRWVCEDIRESIDYVKTLSQYAILGQFSASHFSRLFKKVVGCTFREEIQRVRMEEAAALLSSSTLQVADISRKMGHRNPSTFIRNFRKQHGITPSQFRAMMKK